MDGAMMGTRAGAIDPGIIFHLLRSGYDAAAIEDELNHKSGLLGVSGISLDTRILLRASAAGSDRAQFALDLYAYRLAQCIASLFPTLGGCDALSFTGPIGQHMSDVRAPIVARLAFAGLLLDPARNDLFGQDAREDGPIHVDGGVSVFVIRTLEEWAMVRRACAVANA
jgi:acetate kinase